MSKYVNANELTDSSNFNDPFLYHYLEDDGCWFTIADSDTGEVYSVWAKDSTILELNPSWDDLMEDFI